MYLAAFFFFFKWRINLLRCFEADTSLMNCSRPIWANACEFPRARLTNTPHESMEEPETQSRGPSGPRARGGKYQYSSCSLSQKKKNTQIRTEQPVKECKKIPLPLSPDIISISKEWNAQAVMDFFFLFLALTAVNCSSAFTRFYNDFGCGKHQIK